MQPESSHSSFLQALQGEAVAPPPVWLMRQAGRYLPEYRQLREKAGSFWKLCMTPELAAEVTLHPIRRFGFDAAIIFSDILVIPYALGQTVAFPESSGPVVEEPHRTLELSPTIWHERLRLVYEAVHLVRDSLDLSTPLIGFAGAPWTLALYMLTGRSLDAYSATTARRHELENLIPALTDAITFHLDTQLQSGADAIQLFDSHAGLLGEKDFEALVIEPTQRVVEKLRHNHPKALVIGFPRGASKNGYLRYAQVTGVNAVSLDQNVSLLWATDALAGVTLQGNLDPAVLVAGGERLDRGVDEIICAGKGRPFIFNLGHGVLPETPLQNVERMLKRVRSAA
ncbi:MAG: uroporphyrinogen decarboxylase [Alphaproteobacteria bacterium]